MLPGPAGKFADMKSRGASIEAIQAVIGASLANRAHGEDYSRLHAPAWEMSTGFDSPSWLAALECLDVEEFDEDNEMFEYCVHRTLSKAATHKVPRLLLLVVSLKLRPSGEATAVLKDPTGQLKAAVHRAVLEAEPNFGPGATVSLKEVSLLCPWPGMEYLCITQRNVLQVFPAGRVPPPPPAPVHTPNQGQPAIPHDPFPEQHEPERRHQQVLCPDVAAPLPVRADCMHGARPDLPGAPSRQPPPPHPIILAPPQPVHSGGGSINNAGTSRVFVPATIQTSRGQSLQGAGHVQGATGAQSNQRAVELLQGVQQQKVQQQEPDVAEQNSGAANRHVGVGVREEEEEQDEAAAQGDEEAEEEEEEEEEEHMLSLPQFNVLGVAPPGATSQKHTQQRQGVTQPPQVGQQQFQPPRLPQQPLNPPQLPQQHQHQLPFAKRQRVDEGGAAASAGAPGRQSSVGGVGLQHQHHLQPALTPVTAAATAPSVPTAPVAAAVSSAAMPPPASRKPLFELTGQQAPLQTGQQQLQQQQRQQQLGKQSVPAAGHLQGRSFASLQASQLQQQRAQQMRLSQMMPDDDEDIEL